jgi:hypothetical protein
MSLDCKPAAAAERRRLERAIHTIRPTTTRAPSRIHSQSRSVPEEAPGEAEVPDGAGVVTPCVGA